MNEYYYNDIQNEYDKLRREYAKITPSIPILQKHSNKIYKLILTILRYCKKNDNADTNILLTKLDYILYICIVHIEASEHSNTVVHEIFQNGISRFKELRLMVKSHMLDAYRMKIVRNIRNIYKEYKT